jgi:hypothetical protein
VAWQLEGVSSSRVTEIPTGETTRPLQFTLDEIVYVVSGRGLSTIWYDNSSAKKASSGISTAYFCCPMVVTTPSATCRATGPCGCFTTSTCQSRSREVTRRKKMCFILPIGKSPISVMIRGTLERVLGADQLNAWFAQTAQKQYTRTLLFSTVYDVLSQVVFRIKPSVHAA